MSEINLDHIREYSFHAQPCTVDHGSPDGLVLVVPLVVAESLAREAAEARRRVVELEAVSDRRQAAIDALVAVFKTLSETDQDDVIAYARFIVRRNVIRAAPVALPEAPDAAQTGVQGPESVKGG